VHRAEVEDANVERRNPAAAGAGAGAGARD